MGSTDSVQVAEQYLFAREVGRRGGGLRRGEAPVDFSAVSVGGLVPETSPVLELAEGGDSIPADALA
jgi:hypothetical protein